jgi:hypothetical protein
MELEHKEDERKNLVFTGIERYDMHASIARLRVVLSAGDGESECDANMIWMHHTSSSFLVTVSVCLCLCVCVCVCVCVYECVGRDCSKEFDILYEFVKSKKLPIENAEDLKERAQRMLDSDAESEASDDEYARQLKASAPAAGGDDDDDDDSSADSDFQASDSSSDSEEYESRSDDSSQEGGDDADDGKSKKRKKKSKGSDDEDSGKSKKQKKKEAKKAKKEAKKAKKKAKKEADGDAPAPSADQPAAAGAAGGAAGGGPGMSVPGVVVVRVALPATPASIVITSLMGVCVLGCFVINRCTQEEVGVYRVCYGQQKGHHRSQCGFRL